MKGSIRTCQVAGEEKSRASKACTKAPKGFDLKEYIFVLPRVKMIYSFRRKSVSRNSTCLRKRKRSKADRETEVILWTQMT